MIKLLKIALVFLSLNLIGGNIGQMSARFNILNAEMLLLLFGAICIHWKAIKVNRQTIFGLLLIIAALIGWSLSEEVIHAMIYALWYLLGVNFILTGSGQKEELLLPYIVATFFYLLFMLYYQYVPLVTYLQEMSRLLSIILTLLTGHKQVKIGYSYLGIPVFILFLICLLSFFFLARKRNLRYLFAAIFVATAALILNNLFRWPFLLVLVGVVVLWLFCKNKQTKMLSFSNKKNILTGSIAVLLVFSAIVILIPFASPKAQPGHILFYGKGLLSWDKPVYGQYGAEKGAVFGCLPNYLKASGYKVTIWDDKITKSVLSSVNTLVVINPLKEFTPAEKKDIWNFVRSGGSLLVMGDHTNIGGIMDPLNDLLKPIGVKFNFDSAIALTKDFRWGNCIEVIPHPITRKIRMSSDVGISIGASLSIPHGSIPFLVGKHAFSDKGDINSAQRAYLGNMHYDRDERIGDLILACECRYHKGKVIVFGDTSSFQNGSLVDTYDFINDIFDYLNHHSNSQHVLKIVLSLVFLTVAFLFFPWRQFSIAKILALILILSLLLKGIFLTKALIQYNQERVDFKGNVALIDNSHMEKVGLINIQGNETRGLSKNLFRLGYLPLSLKKLQRDKLESAKLLVIIAPLKPFTRKEIKQISSFVENGGILVVSVGYEDARPIKSLLNFFHVDIDNVPLGAAHVASSVEKKRRVYFQSAWPVTFEKKPYTVLCTAWDFSIVVYQQYEKGGILIIGDSFFFLDKNLEGRKSYNEDNILFMKEMIEFIRKASKI